MIGKGLVEQAWDLLPKENCNELLLNQISLYSHDKIAVKLSILDGDYAALSNRENSHNATLYDNNYNRELINY